MLKRLAWTKREILARNSGETKSFWDDTLSVRDSTMKDANSTDLLLPDNPPKRKATAVFAAAF
jgi:hypothetical protein